MKDCYKKYWKTVLAEKMRFELPMFTLKESASKKASEELSASNAVTFTWNPIGKLNFVIEYDSPGRQDGFVAYCRWSEQGSSKKKGLYWLDHPYAESNFEASDAIAQYSALSQDFGDSPRVMRWKFWEPAIALESTPESEDAWKAEFIAEELRVVGDDEARKRVEAAVVNAMIDIKRSAMPWFEKKLEWYEKHRAKKTIGSLD